MVRKTLSEVLTFDWRFKYMREKARRIPGVGVILDRVNSNFKSLEIDIYLKISKETCVSTVY